MCYTNILQILDLSQIGIYAKDRREDAPFVIGGGPCTYNPEPLADFFDMFYIGESETVYYDLMDLYKEHKKNGGNRKEFLRKASHIPGIYVPSLYETTYNEDGSVNVMNEFPLCLECEFIEYQDNAYGCGVIGKVVNVTADDHVMENGKLNMSLVNVIFA